VNPQSQRGKIVPVTLVLEFDKITKRLIEAQLLESDVDITEAVNIAIASNDVPGLIAEVLMRLRPLP